MTPTGEPEFNAPEMLKNNKLGTYDEKVDIWGLGICVYMMLSGGISPFYHSNLNKMIEQICSENYEINPPNTIQDDRAFDLVK
jgi:serine/threonine protein kinase